MATRRRLFVILAKAALLLTGAFWALVLGMMLPAMHRMSPDTNATGAATAVLIPDGLAAWWVFRKFRVDRSRHDALKITVAFAVSAPLVLGIGNLVGYVVGGYAEVFLGSSFILPAVAAVTITLMGLLVPTAVLAWVRPHLATDEILQPK